jgi:hypothetical protein
MSRFVYGKHKYILCSPCEGESSSKESANICTIIATTVLSLLNIISGEICKKNKAVLLLPCRWQWGKEELLLIPDLCTRWGWVVSISPGHTLPPGKGTPRTHFIGGWVGLRASVDTEARGKILYLCRGWNPIHPVCSKTLYWLSYPSSWRNMVLYIIFCQT